MTGGGFGRCGAGGYGNVGMGRGMGRGMGGGWRGRGFGGRYAQAGNAGWNAPLSPEDEQNILRQRLDMLEREAEVIRTRLNEQAD